MTRNVVLGCLGATLLTLIVLGLAGYFLVWRPAQNLLESFGSFTAPFQNRSSEAPPPPAPRANVTLTSAQVSKFVRVRRAVRDAVGQDFERLQSTYRDFTQGQPPGTLELLGVLREAGGFIGRARQAQQAALQREGLSEGEFVNVRREVNRTLGVPEIDLQVAARALQSGRLPEFSQVAPPPDERNRRLIEPHLNELRETAPLGLIGL